MQDMLTRAREGGVNVAFGTDSGVSQHGKNGEEFIYMVNAGFSPEEAIKAATVNASIHIEMDAQVGTLEPGKFADMVVLRNDPLKDVRALQSSISMVVKNGETFRP
jgi:imidazolonepropionase-like amidohydrolase